MDFLFEQIKRMLVVQSASTEQMILMGFMSFVLGMTHTLGPGHGKSLLLGVLVAESRRLGHALKMAFVIGLTHMADVIILSLLSIVIVASFSFSKLSMLIGTVAGLALIVIGIIRLSKMCRSNQQSDDSNPHHDYRDESSTRNLHHDKENLWAAFFYSLAPCPGAWVLFMACLGLGKPIYGVYLLLGFTLGLITMISLIALSIVYSLKWAKRFIPQWVNRYINVFSALIIFLLGIWILFSSLLGGTHVH